MYIYPYDLTAKATLWLWELRDIAIIGAGLLLSVLAVVEAGALFPLVLTAVYAFLAIQCEGVSVLHFLRCAASFFFFAPQRYDWRLAE